MDLADDHISLYNQWPALTLLRAIQLDLGYCPNIPKFLEELE